MNDKTISKTETDSQNSYLNSFKKLENKVEHMFQNMWHNPFSREKLPDFTTYSPFGKLPKIDVIDRDKEIFVKAELPGFDKEDLDISIANNQLVIKAKSCHEEKEEKGDYLKQEISKSEIYRSLLLPADVEEENVTTSFKNGVLKLTIPKQKKSQRNQIKLD